MIDLSQHIEAIARRLLGVPNAKMSTKTQLRFGTNGSLAVEVGGTKAGTWFDHEQEVGGGAWELLCVKGGMANGEAIDWLRSELGIELDQGRDKTGQARIVATYDYRDEEGALLYQAVRFEPKDFRQRRPNGRGGWEWKLGGVRRVLYRLPELLAEADRVIFIPEGEKDVERLRSLGLLATCNSEGAGKWRPDFATHFRGRHVVVIPDNDDAGRDHARAVVANLAPVAASIRVVELPGLQPKGDVSNWLDADGTRDELERLVEAEAKAEAPSGITATPLCWVDPTTLPRRQWLYGRHLIRGYCSATLAPGGYGKSSLVVAEALAMVTGRTLLDEQPAGQLRVWQINLEDPEDELRRRFAAAALNYKIGSQDIGDRLFVDSGRKVNIVIATESRDGIEIAVPIIEAIKAEIIAKKIDALQIDPFVQCHAVSENDNQKIAAVARQWAMIAEATGCAIELVHHVRKGGSGTGGSYTVDDARGASALIAAVRSARVLNGMTADEAERANVENHTSYFSITNGKANLAPRSDKATWRHIVGVPLGNGDTAYDTKGDYVGVVEPWGWPDPFAEVGLEDAKEVQRRIAKGEWREDQRSTTWAGIVVAEVLGLEATDKAAKAQIRQLLAGWVATGALRVVKRKDETRQDRKFIEVGQWLT